MPRVEDWAGAERLRFYLYLRRGYHVVGRDGGFLTPRQVTRFTRRLEELTAHEALTEREATEVGGIRDRLFIRVA